MDHINHCFREKGPIILDGIMYALFESDCRNDSGKRILYEWPFHMSILKLVFGEFHKFYMKRPLV